MTASLDYGEKFKNWGVAKQLEYLKKLAASQNEALDIMQKERDILSLKVNDLNENLEHIERALYIQKEINNNIIQKQNEDQQHAGARIQELQAKLRSH